MSPDVQQIQTACKISLKFLCTRFLGYKDWSANPNLHDAIEKHLKKPSKFKLILIPRDHLKSSIITKGETIRMLLKNPDIRVLIGNNTWDNARKFLRSIQAYLAPGSLLSNYFGTFISNQWNQDECTIKQRKMILDAPTIATTGLEKEQTSQHYDQIVFDDLVARENCTTPDQRAKVKDYIKNAIPLMEPNAGMTVVGTRWSQDDAYGELIESGEWDVLNLGAYKDPARTQVLFPEKFSVEKLNHLRTMLGGYIFSCQYLNDPINPEAADFRAEWIKTYDPTTPHPSSLYLTIDPAISLARDADYTAMVVAGQFANRRIRVVDYVHDRLVPDKLVDRIFDLVKKWRLHRIGIETFAFQRTLKYEIERQQRERGIFFSIDALGKNHNGKGENALTKEARIRRLQPYFEQGLIEIRADMKVLEDELLHFPRGKHDDLIDALSYQIEFLYPAAEPSLPEKTPEYIKRPVLASSVFNQALQRSPSGNFADWVKDLRRPVVGIPARRVA